MNSVMSAIPDNSSSKASVLPDSKNAVSSKDSERPHHPYSPSTLQNLEYCPHWRSRHDITPHHRTIAGTRAHGVVESGEDDSRLSDDDAIAAAECLDFVEQRRLGMLAEAMQAREATGDTGKAVGNYEGVVQEIKEAYLPVDLLKFPDCESTTAGYVDRVLINYDQTYAELFDWKFGFWPVEKAEDNLQGIAYTLGLFAKYARLKKATLFFKQPHLGTVSQATFTREQVPALYLRVQTVVARAREARKLNDFSLAKPGVPVCNFCGELGRCNRVCDFACKVGRKFHPLEIPEDITPSMLMDSKQTALGLRLAAVLKIWCDAFRRQVTDRVLRGDAELPAGQKIQEMAKRELIDSKKFKAIALRYLTEAEYESTLESSFGAVEDLISEKAPRGQKKNTVAEFRQGLLDSGAVKMGDSFSFLRAVAGEE